MRIILTVSLDVNGEAETGAALYLDHEYGEHPPFESTAEAVERVVLDLIHQGINRAPAVALGTWRVIDSSAFEL